MCNGNICASGGGGGVFFKIYLFLNSNICVSGVGVGLFFTFFFSGTFVRLVFGVVLFDFLIIGSLLVRFFF